MASPFTLQTLIDTVQGGLLLVKPENGLIIAANQLAAILLATPHPKLPGSPFSQFLPQAEDSSALRNLLDQQGMIYNLPFRLISANGRALDVQLSLREVLLADQTSLVISFSDRSESQLMHQLIKLEHELLQRALNMLKSMNQGTSNQLEDDQLMGAVSIPQLLSNAHAETGRIRRYGGALASMLVQVVNLPPPDDNTTRRQLLRLAGSLCMQGTRDSDQVARQQEDKFLVLMPNTSLDGAQGVAQRLQQTLGQLVYRHQARECQAEVCIGLSALRVAETAPNAMLQRVDSALEQARQAGSNQISRLA
ncbi:PAS domain-containing protein [Aquitalea sp. LB_tupeE]|uniref:PAS domain-containing protein n=1 Tax=Aquitalea sp. LB_tupeE TaxID=2748078 RepID=UPI0015BD9D53|nr:PAS domain-containing protein [Aquitalea sp. LB_tupeE]NWK78613.1 diguanylate cyclase [Aquitalea sp. LB_tupeE]